MSPLSEYYRFMGAHMDINTYKMLLSVKKWSKSAAFWRQNAKYVKIVVNFLRLTSKLTIL